MTDIFRLSILYSTIRLATPLLAKLRPSVDRIGAVTPPLVDVARVLNRAVNELGYNPPGPEEGFLFWLAWYIHDGNSVLAVEDAHGVAWRGLVMFGCSTFGAVLAANPALAPFAQVPICPGHPASPHPVSVAHPFPARKPASPTGKGAKG